MKSILSLILLCGAIFAPSARGQYIWLNLSFKAVLNPTNGLRAYSFTETNIDGAISRMNERLASYERGYRLRRVEPIRNVGGIGDFSGPSKWFNKDPRAFYYPNGGMSYSNKIRMESEAKANAEYFWNFNAINYYVIAGYSAIPAAAGDCAFPSTGTELITLGTVDDALVMLHETGHYFELYHPHLACGCPFIDGCYSTNGLWVGDEGIADTLPVRAGDFCFTNQNLIAQANFNLSYDSCNAFQKNLVDDAFFNLMAYGFDRVLDRLTPGQLDKWTDYANVFRGQAATGKTWFVSPTGSDVYPGNSTNSFRTVAKGLLSASSGGGDIILLRPGNYNQQLTISKPVTLRAAPTNSFRLTARSATIGRP